MEAEPSVACSSGFVFPLHVQADAAAIDIGCTEFLNVQKESAEHASAAKIGMHIDALNPPEFAVSPIAPFKGMSRLTYDLVIDHSHKVFASLGFVNEAADTVSYRHRIEFPSFGFPTERDIEMGNGVHVGGHRLSNLHHDSSEQRALRRRSLRRISHLSFLRLNKRQCRCQNADSCEGWLVAAGDGSRSRSAQFDQQAIELGNLSSREIAKLTSM